MSQRYGKKIINFRTFLFVFVCMTSGILLSLVAYYVLPLGTALLAVLFAFIVLVGARAVIRRDIYKIAAVAAALVLTVYAVVAFFVILETRYALESGETYTLTGRVTERFNYDEEYDSYYVRLDELSADGESIDGKLLLIVQNAGEEFREVECGYRIGVTAEISHRKLIDEDGLHSYYARSDERYSAYVTAASVIGIVPDLPNPLESMHANLRELLIENMGENSGRVAYGMIAGDKFLLDDDISDAFSTAGIGHILAVSGLHIGLIAFALCFVLFKLPLPRNVSRAAVTLMLLAYVVFAGGSPSAVRAFVMCTAGIWSAAFGKTDRLNTLCLGGTVCLCFSPFYLFECGFLLSVSAVFGLVAFAPPFRNALVRLRLPKKIADAVASSLSVQLTISPVLALFFHRFYFWSFFVNAFGISLLSAFFMLFAAVLPFALIPPLGFLLAPFGLFIGGVTAVCSFVSALPLAEIVWQVSPVILLLYPLAFGMSRFVMAERKRNLNIFLLLLCAIVAVIGENSVKATDSMLAAGGDCAVTVVYRGNEKYLLGRFESDNILNNIDENRIGGGSFTVYCDKLTEAAVENIIKLNRARKIVEVRFPIANGASGIKTLTDSGIKATAVEQSDGLFTVAYADGFAVGWLYDSNGVTAYITSGIAHAAPCSAADVVRCLAIEAETDALCLTDWGYTESARTVRGGRPAVYDFATGAIN